MTPAEIEAEAERLFKAWASTLALPADWKLPGEVTRAAWLAVAETSLRARADVTADRDEALVMLDKADEAIDACEDAHDRSTFSAWEVAGKRVREYREARCLDHAKRTAERAS